jgi:drug/metabolite transporter (DMT)-like permease
MEELARLAGIGTGVLLGMATVLLRIGLRYDTPFRAAWFITGVGTAFLLPFTLNAFPDFVQNFSWVYGMLAFLGSGVVGQALGRLALYTCIDTLGPTTAATYKALAPAFTALGAWFFFRERLSIAVLTAYLFKERGRQGFRRWDNRALLAFSAGAVAIMVAYVLFLVGTISAGVAITAALASIEPLAAYAIGLILYRQGEPLKVAQVPGVVFVVIGVAIILLR